jgi:GNAT superfamily N-acetyltransferase
MALYHYRYSSFSGKPSIWLDDLFILEESRGNGLGKRLFDKLIEKSRSIGASHIGWIASDFNTRGKEFYSNIGAKISKIEGSTLLFEYKIDE